MCLPRTLILRLRIGNQLKLRLRHHPIAPLTPREYRKDDENVEKRERNPQRASRQAIGRRLGSEANTSALANEPAIVMDR